MPETEVQRTCRPSPPKQGRSDDLAKWVEVDMGGLANELGVVRGRWNSDQREDGVEDVGGHEVQIYLEGVLDWQVLGHAPDAQTAGAMVWNASNLLVAFKRTITPQ